MSEANPRCDRCVHWCRGDNIEWEGRRAGFGECRGILERWIIADKASEGMERGSGDEEWDEWDIDAVPPPNSWLGVRIAALQAARAYVQDGSEYRADLYTAPDFFCAKFEAAPLDLLPVLTAFDEAGFKVDRERPRGMTHEMMQAACRRIEAFVENLDDNDDLAIDLWLIFNPELR